MGLMEDLHRMNIDDTLVRRLVDQGLERADFRVERERVDVTRDPRFGGDGQRRSAPGLARFYVNDVEVSADDYERLLKLRRR